MRDSGRDPTAPARTRLTTGTGSPEGTVPSSWRPRTKRCSATGSAPPTATTRSETASAVRVASLRRGADRVVAQLLVVLEAEAAVDDHDADQRPAQLEHPLERRRAHLGPSLGLGQTGQHAQPRDDLGGDAREHRAGRAAPGRPRGRPRRSRAPRRAARATARRSPRRCRRRRAAPRRRGRRPRPRASVATVVRPGAPVGPHTATTGARSRPPRPWSRASSRAPSPAPAGPSVVGRPAAARRVPRPTPSPSPRVTSLGARGGRRLCRSPAPGPDASPSGRPRDRRRRPRPSTATAPTGRRPRRRGG